MHFRVNKRRRIGDKESRQPFQEVLLSTRKDKWHGRWKEKCVKRVFFLSSSFFFNYVRNDSMFIFDGSNIIWREKTTMLKRVGGLL